MHVIYNAEVIEAVAEGLQCYKTDWVVLDPVTLAKDGSLLLQNSAISAIKKNYFH